MDVTQVRGSREMRELYIAMLESWRSATMGERRRYRGMKDKQSFATVSNPIFEEGQELKLYGTDGVLRGCVYVASQSGTELNLRPLSGWRAFRFALKHPIHYLRDKFSRSEINRTSP